MTAIDRLLERAGPALADAKAGDRGARRGLRRNRGGAVHPPGPLGDELRALLARRDGFVAFASALRVFPIGRADSLRSLGEWNASGLWRDAYDGMADGLVCFAEDAFGVQFAIAGDCVVTFEPETGAVEPLARSLEGWAAAVLDDAEVLTGFPLAISWQQAHGALLPSQRLVPTIPFVLGGEFSIDNLRALDAVDGMRHRGEIAVQLRDLPDGARVELRVIDDGGPDAR